MTNDAPIGPWDSPAVPVVSVSLIDHELALARSRVKYLEGLVSHHIFVEADRHHSGGPRDFMFTPDHFEGHSEQVIIPRLKVPQEVVDCDDRWAIEEYSRQWAVKVAQELFPDCHLIVSDIDEIPSREQVSRLHDALEQDPLVTLPMVMSYNCVNWLTRKARPVWRSAKAMRRGTYVPGFRFRQAPSVRAEPGQHFRYLNFSPQDTENKHQRYAHAEHDIGYALHDITHLATKYQVALTPEFSRRGSGLLTHVDVEALTEPAQFLAQTLGGSVCRDDLPMPYWDRLTASFLIEQSYTRGGKDSQAPDLQIGHPKLFLTVLTRKVVGTFGLALAGRILRRLRSGRKRRPERKVIDVVRGVYRYGEFPTIDELARRQAHLLMPRG